MSKKYFYSEIFNSIQGEGYYTGVPTAWIRFFLCNLQCNGFGQIDPTNPDTYELPYEDFDVSSVDRVEDLPVWSKGCDSSYTWAKKFKTLMGQEDAKELAARVKNVLRTDSNPEGYFRHPLSGFHMHMCFTGGEPLMPISQNAIVEMHDEFKNQRGGPIEDTMSNAASNLPRSFTFETNGTKPLTDNFVDYFTNKGKFGEELFFSVSPKLWTVAGEKASRAIKPDVIQQYYDVAAAANLGSNAPVNGQLKFVIGDVEEQWQEMEQVIGELRLRGINWPVWVMPVGAREEDQLATAGDVAKKAFERGYCVAARVHTYLFGNAIGT